MAGPGWVVRSIAKPSRRSARGGDAARGRETRRIGRLIERVDAHASASGRRLNEALRVEGNADVQILALEMHEHQIARPQITAPHGNARMLLLLRRPRHVNTGAACGIGDQAAAVESAGLRSAVAV